jgi:hypothetical protein
MRSLTVLVALLLTRTEPGIVKGFMGRRLPNCHRVDGNSKLHVAKKMINSPA